MFRKVSLSSPSCHDAGKEKRHVRLEGRCAIHSRSQRNYDAHMAHLARAYLAGKPNPALHGFLRLDFAQLVHRHGSVVGVVVPRPRLLPVNCIKGE